jgi:hypothetical protein
MAALYCLFACWLCHPPWRLSAFGSLESCKLPFLTTYSPAGNYGIFTPKNLQDFYNIPRCQKGRSMKDEV